MMKKLMLRLLTLTLALALLAVMSTLYATEKPPTPQPVTPATQSPPMLDTKPELASPTPKAPLDLSGSGCEGCALAPADAEGDRIRKQIADLRNQAAAYNKYAQQQEDTAATLRDRLNEAKKGKQFTSKDAEWVESRTMSEVGGKRGKSYNEAPPYIQKDIDDYEQATAKHNVAYGIISGTMNTWAVLKKMVGYQTKDETLQESFRIKWAIEVGRSTEMARRFRAKAQQLEDEANKLEDQLQKR
jgi:hypothetical protein